MYSVKVLFFISKLRPEILSHTVSDGVFESDWLVLKVLWGFLLKVTLLLFLDILRDFSY